MLQCVAVRFGVLQCVALRCRAFNNMCTLEPPIGVLQCIAACCSVLQCVAVCPSICAHSNSQKSHLPLGVKSPQISSPAIKKTQDS